MLLLNSLSDVKTSMNKAVSVKPTGTQLHEIVEEQFSLIERSEPKQAEAEGSTSLKTTKNADFEGFAYRNTAFHQRSTSKKKIEIERRKSKLKPEKNEKFHLVLKSPRHMPKLGFKAAVKSLAEEVVDEESNSQSFDSAVK